MASRVVQPGTQESVTTAGVYNQEINSLPEELLALILSYLPAKEIIANRRICKLWRKVADGRCLWKDKFCREFRELESVCEMLDIRKICVYASINSNLIPELFLKANGNGNLVAEGAWENSPNMKIQKVIARQYRELLYWAFQFESGRIGVIVDLWGKGMSKEFLDSKKPAIEFKILACAKTRDAELTIGVDVIRNVDVSWVVQNGSLPPLHPLVSTVSFRMVTRTMTLADMPYTATTRRITNYPNDVRYIRIILEGNCSSSDAIIERFHVYQPNLHVNFPDGWWDILTILKRKAERKKGNRLVPVD